MHACKPWLEAEIELVKPKIILALGATAAMAIFGKLVKITEARGKVFTDSPFAPNFLVSWPPAAILRSDTDESREAREHELISDLKLAATYFQSSRSSILGVGL